MRKYVKRNRELIRKNQRDKYANDPLYRKAQKKYQVEYRKKNKEKVYAYQREYRRTKLREWHNAWKRKWSKTPKGKLASALKGYRRRSLLKGSIGTHSTEEWNKLVIKFGGRCAICKKKKKLTKDHIKALSKGGRNTIGNLQPLCAVCNARKGNK